MAVARADGRRNTLPATVTMMVAGIPTQGGGRETLTMLTHAVSADLESVASAQRRLLEQVRVLAPETVGLDLALGRILAEPVTSRSDLPGFDNSAMDGYAVRASDIALAAAGRAGPPSGRRRIPRRGGPAVHTRRDRDADHDRCADARRRGHGGPPGGHVARRRRRCSSRSPRRSPRASARAAPTCGPGTP